MRFKFPISAALPDGTTTDYSDVTAFCYSLRGAWLQATSANSLDLLAHSGPRQCGLAVFLHTSAQNYSERNGGEYGEATFPISHLAACSVVS